MGREPQERGGVPSEALASDMGNRVGGALRHGGFWRKVNQGVTDKKASRLSPVHIPVYKALYHVYFCNSASHHGLHIKTMSYLYSHPKYLVC